MGVFVSVLALASSLPIEDTAEVKEDMQEPQIGEEYLEDDEAVAEAKAAFLATFAEVEAGGLADLQEPAPVHVIPEPAPLPEAPEAPAAPVVPFINALPAGLAAYPYSLGYPYASYPYALPHFGLPAFGYHGLPYAGLPVLAAAPAAEE